MTNGYRWLLAAMAVCATGGPPHARAADEWSARFADEVRLGGEVAMLRASVPFAKVRITGTERDDTRARAVVELRHPLRGRAAEIVREYARLELVQDGTDAKLRLQVMPPADPGSVDEGASMAAELEIEVPRGVGVEWTSQFGDVEVARVSGAVRVAAASGTIEVRDCPGDVILSADFGRIAATDVGRTQVSSSHANVALRGAQAAYVENSFDSVTVVDVAGDVEINATHAPIDVDRVGGTVRIRNSFHPVTIRGSSGSIDIETSGAITVSQVQRIPEGCRWQLATRFNPVQLYLPAAADVTVRALSQFGPLETSFAMERRHGWDEEGIIRLGDADRAEIGIRNTGAIQVLREKGGE